MSNARISGNCRYKAFAWRQASKDWSYSPSLSSTPTSPCQASFSASAALNGACLDALSDLLRQQALYFFSLPHGQVSFLPIFGASLLGEEVSFFYFLTFDPVVVHARADRCIAGFMAYSNNGMDIPRSLGFNFNLQRKKPPMSEYK